MVKVKFANRVYWYKIENNILYLYVQCKQRNNSSCVDHSGGRRRKHKKYASRKACILKIENYEITN